MNKVTYLIGAGASAEALPLVKTNPDLKIEGLPDAFKRIGDQIENHGVKAELKDLALSLKKDLYWLAEKSEQFDTVDTFAKYCYLKDQNKLIKIKRLLAIYFTVDQIINKKLDNRYLVFYTTILENSVQFPGSIKILNWNYDSQLQLASYQFKQEGFAFGSNSSFMQSDPLLNYYPGIGFNPSPVESDFKNFSLVHLNGIAGYFQDQQNIVYSTMTDDNSLEAFLDSTLKSLSKYINLISFAWESSPDHRFNKNISIAKEIIKESDILVVIGYSFPFFNREVDRALFNVLIQSGLKKIYYQDKYRKGDFLHAQFGISELVDIINVEKVDQLFIPNEL